MQAIGCHVHGLFIIVQVAKTICSSKSYNSNSCENNYIFIHPCTHFKMDVNLHFFSTFSMQ
jgi:hypothetical protein